IALLDIASGRQRSAAVKDSYVVQSKKAALKDIFILRVFAVDPPCKVEQELMKDALKEHAIRVALLLLINFVDAPCSPCQHRRIDITKGPLIGWKLSIGMHVPLAHQQIKLALGKFTIDQRKRNTVEREVPGRIPWIFPLVRHRHYALVVQMPPVLIAPVFALRRR